LDALPHTLFISDLHLTAERPQINQQCFDFLERVAPAAQALYILGDLFEYWVGDDDTEDALNTSVAAALAKLTQRGVPVYFMHGNRDVLVGQAFAARSGAQLIADPTIIDLHGTRTLLIHGDSLCTDDIEYQKFRVYTHDPKNQSQFLQQPLAARHQQMLALRAQSEASKSNKAADIMDVSLTTVEQTLRDHNYPRLIHGHTHRPARHVHTVDGHECERWVLGDWYQRGSYLRCDSKGCEARPR
jgi:UDP-2,3-diacylglucosamine hydrolase